METSKSTMIMSFSKKDVIDKIETCYLCGGKLQYRHQTDFYNFSVIEECKCPQCGIANNPVKYTLQ